MTYIAELMVDDFGALMAPEDAFPINAGLHDWTTPYPAMEAIVPFEWQPGSSGVKPNVFWCPLVRDFVCDEHAFELMSGIAPTDVSVIGHGLLNDRKLYLI